MTHDPHAAVIASLRAMLRATECSERALPESDRLAAIRRDAARAWHQAPRHPLTYALGEMLHATTNTVVHLALIVPARQLALAALADAAGLPPLPPHQPLPPVLAPLSLLEAARTYLNASTHALEGPLHDAIEREDQACRVPPGMGNLPPAQHAVAASYETHWSDVIARYPDAEAREPGLTERVWVDRHPFVAPAP